MDEFRIHEEDDIHVLLRSLIEAKFPRLPRDGDLATSPSLARMAEVAADAHQKYPSNPGADGRWRQLSNKHSYWQAAIDRALLDAAWLRETDESKKLDYFRLLVAPFIAAEPIVRELYTRVQYILDAELDYQLWVRVKNPFGDGTRIVKQRNSGVITVFCPSDRSELFETRSKFDLSDWLSERGLELAGCYVEEPSVTCPRT